MVDFARETALKILHEINEQGAYLNIVLNKHLNNTELKDIDRSFITEMVYGVTKWRLTLDWIIEQFSSVRLKKISPWILNILRLGTYQIIHMDKVPDSAACNESVNLSRKYGHQAASRFVNAVLRNISRNKDRIEYPDRGKDFLLHLSVKYSHPEWLVRHWTEVFGIDFTESLLASNNEIPDLTVRVNSLRTSRENLIELLKREGVEVSYGRHVDEAIILKSTVPIARLDAFKKGLFQVQDESSMLVGRVLDPKPEEFIMDVCSAPGGKSTHIAQLMGNRGRVLARDVHEHRIKLIEEATRRLGLDIIYTEVYDALQLDNNYIGKADRVLVDAPCTGFGIIRRKPDIKWAKDTQDKNEILKLQERILDTSSKYVKPGGILVYSTCTIENDENMGVVQGFLDNNRDFSLMDITDVIPSTLLRPDAKNGFIQLYPNVDGIDGFFIAKMKRRG